MSHFAKVFENKVLEVIVAEQEWIDENPLPPGQSWIQTSYNTQAGQHLLGGTPLRKNYAGVGYTYDPELDAFIPPRPFDNWRLNTDTCQWEPPYPPPQDGQHYIWNRDTAGWIVTDEPRFQPEG